MSVLYPRLLDHVAAQLFTEFAAVEGPSELARRAQLRHAAAVFTATGGRRVDTRELAQLREAVLVHAHDAGFPAAAAPSARAAFDIATARLLHAQMGLVPAEASVRAIWVFLALVVLPDVTFWRFPAPPADRVLGTDITRHIFGRLWWRAYLLHDNEQGDPYTLINTFGEAAFDQIFARRRALGGSRTLIRSLAAEWPTVELGGHTEREVLRETLKRLLRHGAFQEFESLDRVTISREIASVVRESVAGLDG